MQCKKQAQQAYYFVLHDLWPSIDKTCTQEKLSDAVIVDALSVISSKKLIEHEWQKHGRCSGFDPSNFLIYLSRHLQKLKSLIFLIISIPKQLKKLKKLKLYFY